MLKKKYPGSAKTYPKSSSNSRASVSNSSNVPARPQGGTFLQSDTYNSL